MRSGKELLQASKEFTTESRVRSWLELTSTLFLIACFFVLTALDLLPVYARVATCIVCGLLYVRLFVIYHDYQHRAILQNSFMAEFVMIFTGIYLLAPKTIWVRSHEHHHNNNSKLTVSGIGSYPTITKKHFLRLSKKQRLIYLVNRHPLTIIFGYFTLFVYWLNLKSFVQSPGRHLDSLASLVFHAGAGFAMWYFLGPLSFWLAWFTPFFIAFGTGSYLFYCQHNFPGAKFKENPDWTYVNAALSSTSCMKMNGVMHWFTANIGYHHVHHVNSRIPFYRLKEARDKMPELAGVTTTSWNLLEVYRCFRLKLWDAEKDKMITLQQL